MTRKTVRRCDIADWDQHCRTVVGASAHRRAAGIDRARKIKIAKQAALADKLDVALEHQRKQRKINRTMSARAARIAKLAK